MKTAPLSPSTQRPVIAAPTPTASVLRILPWMAGWLVLMTIIAMAGRQALRELSVFQLMEMRSVIGMLLLAPLVYAGGGLAAMRSRRASSHLARNTMHYAAQYGWFLALTLIPLAQVVAIEFTMPLWTALLAAAFLHERLHRWKLVAVALGLFGVVVIVRPATTGVSPGQAIALAAALGFAVSFVLVKSLTRTDNATQVIFWMLVIQSLIGLVPASLLWRWPSSETWGWVLLVAFCGTYSHYCLTRAVRLADATVVVPIDFLRVPLAALAGWLAYGEQIDWFMAAGTALILLANLLNLRRPPAAASTAGKTVL